MHPPREGVPTQSPPRASFLLSYTNVLGGPLRAGKVLQTPIQCVGRVWEGLNYALRVVKRVWNFINFWVAGRD